jgi:alpha-L-fucosidase 2
MSRRAVLALLFLAAAAGAADGLKIPGDVPFLSTPHTQALDLRDELTLEAWIKPGKLSSGGARIVDKSIPGTQEGFVLDTCPGNSLRMICDEKLLSHKAKLPANKWSHVAAVFSRPKGVYKLFVGGVAVADAGRSGMKPLLASRSPLRVGADSKGGNAFKGAIRRVGVYSRALSDAEVAALAKQREGLAPLEGAVGVWELDSAQDKTFVSKAGGKMKLQPPKAWIAPMQPAKLSGEATAPEDGWVLWYRRPAAKWEEALPIGNGRLGAMVFGGVAREHLQFNEDTVWAGKPHDYAHEGAVTVLPELRKLLWEGKQRDAQNLATKEFMSVPLRQMAYQPCGDLWIDMAGHEEVSGYRRFLDIENAYHRVEYRIGDAAFTRESFATYPDQVIVTRVGADRKGQVTCTIRLSSPHGASTSMVEGNRIVLSGRVADDGVAFESHAVVRAEGGKLVADAGAVTVTGADSVTVVLTAATNVKSWKELGADPGKRCDQVLRQIEKLSFQELLVRHVADYAPLYGRVELDLGRTEAALKPTDQRIIDFEQGNDPHLAALTFQYGRYLLIACSRPGSQPANLQGVWNPHLRPPWDSKYTCNINTEMNYWPAEVTGLSECHDALFTALGELRESGAKVAKAHYGARGWVTHHNFDLWRGAAPINASNHGIWVTGGAWMATHLWERYLFTLDQEFLRERAYPLLREAALFFVDYLVEDPKTKWLISGPSNSPEQGGLVMGPTMDHQIIRLLFQGCVEAAAVLKTDTELAKQLSAMIPRIAPNQIGQHGQLQEWLEDKDNPKNKHRHVSHLWGAYPGHEVNWQDCPDMWKAAQQSLIHRGDAATGWSMGWKVCLWTRYLDGDHSYLVLGNLLSPIGKKGRGGMYPNLFDAHPPFQIDGNFGACAGIAEMFVQSHVRQPGSTRPGDYIVHLLPAVPRAWAAGSVSGLRARGGRTVAIEWKGGKLVKAMLTSLRDGPCPVRYAGKTIGVETKAGETVEVGPAQFR